MTNEALALIIFGVCIVLFISKWVNTCVAAALGCIAFTVTGICDFSEAFAGFSNSVPILIFGSLIVGDALSQVGLDKVIGRFVMRMSKNSERRFIFVAGLVSGLMSMWMANTAVVACFLPIIASVAHASGNKMTMKNMTMSITFGAMFGGSCTLVGSTSQLAAHSLMEEMTGSGMKMFDLMPAGIIMLIAYLVWVQVFGYKLGIKIWGDRQLEGIQDDAIGKDDSADVKLDKRKSVCIIIIFTLMILSYVAGWLPSQITALTAAMLCFVTRCADPKLTMRRIDWNSILFLGCTIGLANGLMATNIESILLEKMTIFFGREMDPMVFLMLITLATMVLSNFLANATTTFIFTPLAITICQTYGFNVLPFCLAIAYAASTTCATPMAHAQITMTLVAGYRFTDYVKANMPVQIITFILIVIFVPLFFPLVG